MNAKGRESIANLPLRFSACSEFLDSASDLNHWVGRAGVLPSLQGTNSFGAMLDWLSTLIEVPRMNTNRREEAAMVLSSVVQDQYDLIRFRRSD